MSDMPRPRPPHLQRGVSRHGKAFWFVQMRRGAPKIRIRGEYGSPEFEAAYQAAVSNASVHKVPDIKAAIAAIGPDRVVQSEGTWAVLHDPEGHNVLLLQRSS